MNSSGIIKKVILTPFPSKKKERFFVKNINMGTLANRLDKLNTFFDINNSLGIRQPLTIKLSMIPMSWSHNVQVIVMWLFVCNFSSADKILFSPPSSSPRAPKVVMTGTIRNGTKNRLLTEPLNGKLLLVQLPTGPNKARLFFDVDIKVTYY